MSKFRKKPVVIEAVQIPPRKMADGPDRENMIWATMSFLGHGGWRDDQEGYGGVFIETLEGDMHAQPGDWIIRGVKGELYPCKPDIFDATYEPA